jgi:hypothetical protein
MNDELTHPMSDNLPVCGKCGEPVCKSSVVGSWHHTYVKDLFGYCYWGRPGKPSD